MTNFDTLGARVPVHLERYAVELTEWERDIRNARAQQLVPSELNTHPKDRALFARITSVLAEYDGSTQAVSRILREGNPK